MITELDWGGLFSLFYAKKAKLAFSLVGIVSYYTAPSGSCHTEAAWNFICVNFRDHRSRLPLFVFSVITDHGSRFPIPNSRSQ